MTEQEAMEIIMQVVYDGEFTLNSNEAFLIACKCIEKQMHSGWIPIKTRPMTSEECEDYGVDDGYIYDCRLPDGGDEVLISTKWGVEKTTFYTDDGYYFEQYEDDGDVLAWMPLPEPYKEEGDAE